MPKVVVTKNNLPKVLSILDKWRGKLTWVLYCEEVASQLGLDSVHRSTLDVYSEIKVAFKEKKKALKDPAEIGNEKNATIEMLQNEIEELESKEVRLEDKLTKYKEKFVRWQHNLYMMPGVDLEKHDNEIDDPLPPVKRSE